MKRKKSISKTKRKFSPSSTKKGKWKKRPRPVKQKKEKKKGRELAQAFAAIPKRRPEPEGMPKWMMDDEIPMRHMPSGRPLGSRCTCKVAPNKYCWKCKTWAAREDITPDQDMEPEEADLWADVIDIPNR